ncbi:hypothetical protein E2562_020901 [Oryza meyeriana var. granulata]|uniref:Uncharacterized protein n=1 Tax=Oryza meyeriana var. granulata TaxID=110450 RepID=A0A6G1D4S1_9ORYZ|nr:hypothetical protein E2562_020901 [Oryza meyeriana var. granulata]
MARPRATAAASRPRRATTKPKSPSFLSPVAPPPAAHARASRCTSSSPSSPATPTAAGLSFLSSPGSSASPKLAPPKSRSSRRPTAKAKPAARSPLVSPRTAASPLSAAAQAPAPSPASAAVSSVRDLRSVAASQMEALKRRLDALHSRAHTDLDASLSRASKRFKTQNQACQQLTDEVDKEYKKISDSTKKNTEMIKVSFVHSKFFHS